MTKKTLYISDLDGTLLTSRQTISPFTRKTINELVGKGMIFSYATARSYHSASALTAGLTVPIPIIVNNGVFILENGSWRRIHGSYFTRAEAARILDALHDQEVHPLVYTYLGELQKFSYLPDQLSRGTGNFLSNHPDDPRRRPVMAHQLLDGDIFYFTCIDEPEKLFPVYEKFREEFHCVYQKDIYDGEQWLEIMPRQATKASAALRLKEMMGCDCMVAFGDGVNDLPLFSVADASYAMANGEACVKQAATAVIGHHDEDGVAKWLLAHWQP